MGKQQGICGNPLYLLLNFAVNLQMQKSVSACLLQRLSAILLPNCPHHRKGSLTVSRVPSLPLGCRALSAQKPPWRQEWAEGQRQAELRVLEPAVAQSRRGRIRELVWPTGAHAERACRETTRLCWFFPEVSHAAVSDLLGMETGLGHCLQRPLQWLPSHWASGQHHGPGPQRAHPTRRLPVPQPPHPSLSPSMFFSSLDMPNFLLPVPWAGNAYPNLWLMGIYNPGPKCHLFSKPLLTTRCETPPRSLHHLSALILCHLTWYFWSCVLPYP